MGVIEDLTRLDMVAADMSGIPCSWGTLMVLLVPGKTGLFCFLLITFTVILSAAAFRGVCAFNVNPMHFYLKESPIFFNEEGKCIGLQPYSPIQLLHKQPCGSAYRTSTVSWGREFWLTKASS